MNNEKPLRDMSLEEIAALKPTHFQELAHEHNDHLEITENALQRQIVEEVRLRREKKQELMAWAERNPEEFSKLPYVYDDYSAKVDDIIVGIPDPEDPANPFMYRKLPSESDVIGEHMLDKEGLLPNPDAEIEKVLEGLPKPRTPR